jgi:hypothetical protein
MQPANIQKMNGAEKQPWKGKKSTVRYVIPKQVSVMMRGKAFLAGGHDKDWTLACCN